MRKTTFLLAIGLASLTLTCVAVASNPFVNPDEPHGVVRTDARQSASLIFPVEVLEVDGDLVSVSDMNAIWLKPGKHTLTIHTRADLSNVFGIKRTFYNELPNDVSLTVEEGKVYYVGMKAIRSAESQSKMVEFKPVVWKVSES